MREISRTARGHNFRTALLSAAGLAVAIMWSGSALAQDANVNNNDPAVTIDDDQGPGNVIIVTAQLREQNVQDIPLASARSAETCSKRAAKQT